MSKKEKFDIARMVIGVVILGVLLPLHFVIGENKLGPSDINTLIILPISLIVYILIAYDFFIRAFKNFKKKRFFDEITLTIIASIAAFCVNQAVEALAVALFFQIGEKFEDYAVNKSRKSIKDVLDLRSDKARIIKNFNSNNEEASIVDPYDVNIDDIILVNPGERVPLDGFVIKGSGFIDTSSLTGESVPRKIRENDEILSGVMVNAAPLYIKVSKMFYDSTTSKIMDLVENATNNKTSNEKFITKFSKYYTPVVVILAFLIAVITPFFGDFTLASTWQNSVFNAASLLVVSCPCALVLSVPMAYFVGIGEASKVKMIIKGSVYLEKLSKLDTVILDKTGTITKGNFVVNKINPSNDNISKDYILALAKIAESNSNHPIAHSILEARNEKILDKNKISNLEEIEGKGIRLNYDNKELLVGNSLLLNDSNIEINNYDPNDVGTLIYVAYDQKYLGYILIKDEIKEDSISAIKSFPKVQINDTYMLTGDNKETAKYIASLSFINNYKYSLLPLDKVNEVKKIKKDKGNKIVGFVGDGINDAPSMSIVDLAFSMGNIGSDVAIEASDIVIMDDKLSTLVKGKKIAKRTINVVYQNIIFSLVIKLIAIILTSINTITPFVGTYIIWISIFADVGVTFIAVCNSLRLMLYKHNKV